MIKKFAELDKNNIVIAIRDYETPEKFNTPSFLVELKDPLTIPDIGTFYKDRIFYKADSTITIEYLNSLKGLSIEEKAARYDKIKAIIT